MSDATRVTCPCCGLPTLPCRLAAVCAVCWWESDPVQDGDPDAAAGPNHGYSLRRACANFRDHGHMYDLGAEIRPLRSESAARARLMAYVREVLAGHAELDAVVLERLLEGVRA